METFALLIAATLNAGTVLALAAPCSALLINERAGIVNLGAEGMMLVAAVAGFATAVHTGNDWLASVPVRWPAHCWHGLRLAGDLAQHQPVRHRPGAEPVRRGFSAFVGIDYVQGKLGERPSSWCRCWATCRSSGRPVQQHPMVYLAIATDRCTGLVPLPQRAGLVLRAVGESPESAHALGYPVRRIRLAAVAWPAARCAAWPGPTCR
jgi:ABC-type uncharacterized transport system permease subunit